jgi:UDP-sulfoquinovose synthase
MRALILGIDGYLGWSLAVEMVAKGHEVMGIDCGLRRQLVEDEGSISAINILPIKDRIEALNATFIKEVKCISCNIAEDYDTLFGFIRMYKPQVIFHLAQMPSAPWSMKDRYNCQYTHYNNMDGTINLLYAVKEGCPDAHIIKIGTMGEYGQPDIPIPEGGCDITIDGRTANLPFPRGAGSWYHQTKVHDTHNIRMACDQWGLRCTDIMQGIVYGTRVSGMAVNAGQLATRLDFDECFGTIINRFVVQAAIGHPLTIYGQGTQIRSILPLQDSINCMLLLAHNPPAQGVYREVNQFHEFMPLNVMADIVYEAAYELSGKKPEIVHINNPRKEKERHFYQPIAQKLKMLGYKNSECIEKVARCMFIDVFENREVLKNYHSIMNPTISWTGDKHIVKELHRN